jgi:hypothetical protein
MQKNRRNGRASTKKSIEDEIAHLRGPDLRGLRSRWQSVFRRPAPAHLTRHLLFAIIAYRLQADRFDDLDHATLQVWIERPRRKQDQQQSLVWPSLTRSGRRSPLVQFWSESGIDGRSG